MSDTLIIRSPRAMTNPRPGADNIIYSDPRILINIRPEDAISVGDGNPVNSLIARGNAPLEERTFGKSGNWLLPTLDIDGANGKPALTFNKNHQISNRNGAAVFPVARTQPFSFIVVVKITSLANNNRARIVGGSNTGVTNIQPVDATPARLRLNFGATVDRDVNEQSGWAVHTVVANGSASLIKIGNRAIETVPLGPNSSDALHIGGNTVSDSEGLGFGGQVAELLMFEGALTSDHVLRWYNFLTSKYGISQ